MNHSARTFRAPNARAALAAVKAALGAEAVIVSTREVSAGLFRPREIEVMAMTEGPGPELPPGPAAPMAAYAPPKPDGQTHRLAGEMADLRRTLEEIQREVREQAIERGATSRHLPSHAADLMTRLLERGMEPKVAADLIDQALRMTDGHVSAFLQAIREQLSQRLVPARAPWLRDSRRVIGLVGPTGVGKTTTLAKIAARALLDSRMKVALITVDTYRVGASEQVCRYGNIMKIPTYVARDVAALRKAMADSASADLVLIDTAGRSVNEVVVRQAELLRSIPEVQLHLVLSAATGSRDLAATTERYRDLNPERFIFTKLDEAAAPGGLLSATARLDKPICAVADGQRVPEDIHCFTSTELMDWVGGFNELSDATGVEMYDPEPRDEATHDSRKEIR
jgi:flagellar biosynthesis protein FlhF